MMVGVVLAMWIGAIVCFVLLWRETRGTTLLGVWIWGAVAVSAVDLAEACIRFYDTGDSPGWATPLRFAAAMTTFCPMMALLGAKRPQDKAWHFITLTLWGILALPAGEQWLLQPEQPLEVQDARAWFLLLLIVVSPINHLGTRLLFPSVLLAGGQWLLLKEFLPTPIAIEFDFAETAALALGHAALAWLTISFHLSNRDKSATKVWLDFRDRFGVLWSLRIMDRLNQAAESHEWPFRLRWGGFVPETENPDDSHSKDWPEAMKTAWRNLLRRFVSEQWISERNDESA